MHFSFWAIASQSRVYGITKQSIEAVDSIPGLISSPASILRLWDDLGSAKDESQDGNDGSYVELYMKENGITSPSVARDHVMHRIYQEWKELNKEMLLFDSLLSIFQRSLPQHCTFRAHPRRSSLATVDLERSSSPEGKTIDLEWILLPKEETVDLERISSLEVIDLESISSPEEKMKRREDAEKGRLCREGRCKEGALERVE
ncbi:hypothetical protein ACLOJK_020442 [Asimina triloba]